LINYTAVKVTVKSSSQYATLQTQITLLTRWHKFPVNTDDRFKLLPEPVSLASCRSSGDIDLVGILWRGNVWLESN